MDKSLFILSADQLPDWVEYPQALRRLLDSGLVHFSPWHLMEGHDARTRYEGLKVRYPSRQLFPFAYRQDNDDIACWEKGLGEKVVIVHDFASPGWESEGSFDDVWCWFRAAIEEMIAWD